MSSAYRAVWARQLKASFQKENGFTVVWNVACWSAVKEVAERAIVRPFSSAEKAAWAKKVLEAEYPGRTYEAYKETLGRPIEDEQLKLFESMATDELFKLELEQKRAASES